VLEVDFGVVDILDLLEIICGIFDEHLEAVLLIQAVVVIDELVDFPSPASGREAEQALS
jgi:hypothetical protein